MDRIIDFNEAASVIYGDIRHALGKSGKLPGNMDLLIAASALAIKAVVVSHNIKHFSRIKGLMVEDWTYESDNRPQ